MPSDFIVDRADLSITKLTDVPALAAGSGELVMHVDRFALTANNVTYGVAGDLIGYWQFFPAEAGWGHIPVWGIGTVTVSGHPDVRTGARYYGYFPTSSELRVKPEKVGARGFTDASPHRAALPAVYNQYSAVTSANGFDPALENHAMVYRPLFTTSFVLDDWLADNGFFGAKTVILSSASSKTAFGLAFLLRRRGGVRIAGLTSPGNVAFVESLGLYDEVFDYGMVESLPRVESAYVDMSGNREVGSRVHHHLRELLVCSCGVGMTHWQTREAEPPKPLPGAKPTMFFAPTQIIKRHKELGPEVYQQRIGEATQAFLAQVDRWVRIEEYPFPAIESVYRTVLQGTTPDRGFVIVG